MKFKICYLYDSLFKSTFFSTPIGSLSDSSNDGAWLCHDCRNSPVLLWVCYSSATVSENCGYLPLVFRAVVIATSLWLWNESCEVSAYCCWESKGKEFKMVLLINFLFVNLSTMCLLHRAPIISWLHQLKRNNYHTKKLIICTCEKGNFMILKT